MAVRRLPGGQTYNRGRKMLERTRGMMNWLWEKKCLAVVKALERRNFTSVYCATASDAAEYILKQAEGAQTVGFGGSMTVSDLQVTEPLQSMGKELLIHGNPNLTPEEKMTVMRRQLTCDLFLASANAITIDGVLVNVDGVGNRVAAMIFGPKKVILTVGRNKIVDGGIEDACKRVRQQASPPNAMRLGKNTPCAITGMCADCASPDRICNVTAVFERKPQRTDFHVLVVNDDLGF